MKICRGTTSVLTVLGTARSDGHAQCVLKAVLAGRPARSFDLGALDIHDYEYSKSRRRDDFSGVAEAMAEADAILFVTPVYWYAMSAVLKRFFDRLTDLVTVQKPLGRRLAGRSVWVAACGSDPSLPIGFEVPFRETAVYFDMRFGGAIYLRMREGISLTSQQEAQAAAFGSRVIEGIDSATSPEPSPS